MPYSLLDEDDKKYLLRDASGKVFPVAKKGLSDHMRAEIAKAKKEVKGYAVGGFVTPDESENKDLATLANMRLGSAFQTPTIQPVSSIAADPTFSLPSVPGFVPATVPPSASPSPNGSGSLAPAITPTPAPITPTPAPIEPALPTTQIVPGPIPATPMASTTAPVGIPEISVPTRIDTSEVDKADAALVTAVKKQADVEAAMATEAANIERRKVAETEKMRADQATVRERRLKEGQDLFQAVQDKKIDATRLFRNASGLQLGMAAFGALLGGVGAGLTGGQNQALAFIDKMVDRDIDEQKTNIDNERNLLDYHRQMTGDIVDAQKLAKADLLDGFAGQLALSTAERGGDKAKAAADITIGQLKQKSALLRLEVADKEYGRNLEQQKIAQAAAEARNTDLYRRQELGLKRAELADRRAERAEVRASKQDPLSARMALDKLKSGQLLTPEELEALPEQARIRIVSIPVRNADGTYSEQQGLGKDDKAAKNFSEISQATAVLHQHVDEIERIMADDSLSANEKLLAASAIQTDMVSEYKRLKALGAFDNGVKALTDDALPGLIGGWIRGKGKVTAFRSILDRNLDAAAKSQLTLGSNYRSRAAQSQQAKSEPSGGQSPAQGTGTPGRNSRGFRTE